MSENCAKYPRIRNVPGHAFLLGYFCPSLSVGDGKAGAEQGIAKGFHGPLIWCHATFVSPNCCVWWSTSPGGRDQCPGLAASHPDRANDQLEVLHGHATHPPAGVQSSSRIQVNISEHDRLLSSFNIVTVKSELLSWCLFVYTKSKPQLNYSKFLKCLPPTLHADTYTGRENCGPIFSWFETASILLW